MYQQQVHSSKLFPILQVNSDAPYQTMAPTSRAKDKINFKQDCMHYFFHQILWLTTGLNRLDEAILTSGQI